MSNLRDRILKSVNPNVDTAERITRNIINIDKDAEYREMIQRLRNAIINGENITKRLKLEKTQFYTNYLPVNLKDKTNLTRSLSLGEYIVRPALLARAIKELDKKNKETKVRKWISDIMRSVMELESRIKTKDLIDQKDIIEEYLLEIVDRKKGFFDTLLETRSEILDTIIKNYKEKIDKDIEQETEIKYLLDILERTTSGKINIVYNRDLENKYIEYLLNGNDNCMEGIRTLIVAKR
ncbi:unnamed protein product, partial [marine sediment metagenome]